MDQNKRSTIDNYTKHMQTEYLFREIIVIVSLQLWTRTAPSGTQPRQIHTLPTKVLEYAKYHNIVIALWLGRAFPRRLLQVSQIKLIIDILLPFRVEVEKPRLIGL